MCHSINDSRIICTSGVFLQGMSEAVVVMIDNAYVSGDRVEFAFREDPIFISVGPQRVIPS